MPSSTSSSERSQETAFARVVPARPWPRLILSAAVFFVLALASWELAMRGYGLSAEDLGDGKDFWAVERRKVDNGPADPIVIIGDSRILFDTDLETWRTITGYRPVQLALPGQTARPILHDLAVDEHFRGLLVIGTAEMSYFADDAGSVPVVLQHVRAESPSQRVGHQLYLLLAHYLAFLDSDYTMFSVLEDRDWHERQGVAGPYREVWKISESSANRQTYLWSRIERDPYLREHARRVWLHEFSGPRPSRAEVDRVIESTRADIERIRSRGGEVVWVRPPSTGPLLEEERARFPRAEVWDRLTRDTGSFGLYFEDYPAMRRLTLPDWSHLCKSSALVFTDAYVRVLVSRVGWLSARLRQESTVPLPSTASR
jgi:hypothetical protein